MANAVNASHITGKAEKCPGASFPNPAKGPITDQLRISIKILNNRYNTNPLF